MKDFKVKKIFFGTVSLQALGRAGAVILGIILARLLGPQEYGKYAYLISIIALAIIPVTAGLPQLIIRECAKSGAALISSNVIDWSKRYVFVMVVFSVTILYLLISLGFLPSVNMSICYLILLLIPLKSCLTCAAAIFIGYGRPKLAQLPVFLLVPFLSIAIVYILYVLFGKIDLIKALFATVFASFLALIITLVILRNLKINTSSDKGVNKKNWILTLLPLSLIGVFNTLNTELAVLFLGGYGNSAAIGYFKVSMQAMLIISIGLQSMNAIIAPKIAVSYKNKRLDACQSFITKSTKLSFYYALATYLFFLIFGKSVVIFVFGGEYIEAYRLSIVLGIGQLINAYCGSVGTILNMSGHESKTIKAQVISLIITSICLYLLVPTYSALGAAISVTIGMVLWNMLMMLDVYKYTKLRTWFSLR